MGVVVAMVLVVCMVVAVGAVVAVVVAVVAVVVAVVVRVVAAAGQQFLQVGRGQRQDGGENQLRVREMSEVSHSSWYLV